MRAATRAVLAGLAAIMAGTTGCNTLWGGPDAEELAGASSTDLLVPDDPRFADSFEFTLQEAPDNYTVRSNWDPAFNPDIDPALAVTGFQIGDPTSWTGKVDAENDAQQAAFRSVLDDSRVTEAGGPCAIATADPEVITCTYDVGQVDPLPLLVRRFPGKSGDITMVVLGATGAALEFVSGTFTRYAIDEAVDRWLTG